MKQWQFWIDRGGTFTDIVAQSPCGEITTSKLLSENPDVYKDAAIEGIKQCVASDQEQSDKPFLIKMGTTVATNALLERKGDATVLIMTRGFADALRIGYQYRPELFSLAIELPDILYTQVIEVDERISAFGDVLVELDVNAAKLKMQEAFDSGIDSVAIAFMHGYQYTQHEAKIAKLAKEIGFKQISTSHETSPLMKLVSRADTTVVDAYLSPILRRYIDQISTELYKINPSDNRLQFMQSNGGLTDATRFAGKDAILSGPAGGVVGMVETATAAGFDKLIGFDMGGTSTDVCHYAGALERAFDTQVAGVRMRAPMMRIHTVAAGGGSILGFDGARYRVGPESAGADPGPTCYGNHGPLSVTDCNVMLGKIQAEFFPHVFGEDANQALNVDAVTQKFNQLSEKILQATNQKQSNISIAEGFLSIAIDNMANAIKQISVQRGFDVQDYTLCCFGGAGGQHACLVADAIGIKRIFLHPLAGVLSAYGMGLADLRKLYEQSVEQALDEPLLESLNQRAELLCEKGKLEMLEQGAKEHQLTFVRELYCHYKGSDTTFPVDFSTLDKIVGHFEEQHLQAFGFISKDKMLMIHSISVEVIGKNDPPNVSLEQPSVDSLCELKSLDVVMAGEKKSTPFYHRDQIPFDTKIQGPAVIIESTGTLVIEPGWQALRTVDNNIILERYQDKVAASAIGTDVNPVMLEIFNNLFMSIAEQMGAVLENTAVSVNIKERLDFSCAIFDAQGDLIANAPHMPVHLGSMSESIKTVIKERSGTMHKGDAYVLNAPYNGGTHLPDVTIIKPVFDDNESEVIFYIASRGHHADIGGITPGSMPAHSTSVLEEGILLDNLKIVDRGRFCESQMREVLAKGQYPARNIDTNIADFKAQLASCEKGMVELLKMVAHYSLPVVHAYMVHVQNNAEESVRRVLDKLSDAEFTTEMDDGSSICVKITLDKSERQACIDFTGTSLQHSHNFNAPTAITRAAVLYVFRCLVGDQIPLNEGCLKPLTIIIPENCMINPQYPAAVVAGNVETSQAIVDTLLGALGQFAASQGTMNNITFGSEHYQYYETLCGGEGASDGHHGCSAVHTHMTNSRLTDPEILEWRFPVLLESFSIRKNSGGSGLYRGGDGVERRLCFNEPMQLSLLTGHRKIAPYGVQGGGDALCGENSLKRANGDEQMLNGVDSVAVEKGDVLIVKTPGGGGFGQA